MWPRGFLWCLLLVVVNGLLLAGIVNIWWGEEAAPAGARSRPGPEVPRAPMLRDNQPLTAFRVVSAKNLFSQERTGPEGLGDGKKGSGSLEGGRLLGIIIVGEEKAALIGQSAPRGVQQVQVVRLGEQFGGYQVIEISSEAVVFQGQTGKQTLNFPE